MKVRGTETKLKDTGNSHRARLEMQLHTEQDWDAMTFSGGASLSHPLCWNKNWYNYFLTQSSIDTRGTPLLREAPAASLPGQCRVQVHVTGKRMSAHG